MPSSAVSGFERQLIERLRVKVRAKVRIRLTDSEMAELALLHAQSDTSLACEGMYASERGKALAAMLDEERIPPGARIPYIIEFHQEIERARRNQAAE
jgi:hypothetical protein